MRAIIIKEIRENAIWALLMSLGLSAALGYAVHADARSGLSLVGNVMVMVSAVGFPIIGFALGLLQVLQDRRIGRWGFLTHRPISRTKIFFAKVIAGLLLYVLSSGLPLAVVVPWVATPGHLSAPFDWHMILPRLSDLLGGIIWYSTGLLVAAREARWIGSRLMPMGLAFLIAVYAWVVPLAFWQALLFFVGGSTLIFPAALTAFTAHGVFQGQPAISRLLQVLSIGTGWTLLTGAAMAILIATIEWMAPPPPTAPYQQYHFTPDGQVLRLTIHGNRPTETTDLQGRPVKFDLMKQLPASNASVIVPLRDFPPDQSDWSSRRATEGLQNSDSYLCPLGRGGSNDLWFYVTPRRTIEGFNFSHRFIGSIGPQGFRPPSQPATPFPDPLYPNRNARLFHSADGTWTLIATRTRVYQVDLERRQIRVLFETSPNDPLMAIPEGLINGKGEAKLAIVVTRSHIHIFDGDEGRQLFELPFPQSSLYQILDVERIDQGKMLFYFRDWWHSGHEEANTLIETDASGGALRRMELPPLGIHARQEPQWRDALQYSVAPPFLIVLSHLLNEPIRRVTLLVATLVGLASAAITLLLHRRYALDRRATLLWTIFNLFTGLPGVFAFLSLRQLPPRVRCPTCGRLRAVSRETCEHCGAPFAPPSSGGIEVFEMV